MNILNINKEDYEKMANNLSNEDISSLIDVFYSKDRCIAFSLLSIRSENFCDVYPHWQKFENMLKSENAFEKTIGLKLISLNTKWDKDKFNIDSYLKLCNDKSLVVARACIQGLKDILINKQFDNNLCDKITKYFSTYDIKKRPNTNWNVLEKDVCSILDLIVKH